MKEKARIPLLVGHIVANVGLLILIVIVFGIFAVSGLIAGAVGSIAGGAEAGSELVAKTMLTGYIIDIFLALVIALDVVNLICGFRKKPSGKTLSAFMIADLSLASLLCVGIASYFIKNAAAEISSGSSDASGSVLLVVFASLIALAYIALYSLTIAFIYVPRIKRSEQNDGR